MKTTVFKAGLLAAGLALPATGIVGPAICPELLTTDYWISATAPDVERCIAAGADGSARTTDGDTPFDLAKKNENRDRLEGTKAWRRLNEAQYE